MLRTMMATVLTGFSIFACAQSVRVVPGSSAAYLYFPADGDSRSVLKVIKETGMGLTDNYEVYVTFENEPEEILCLDTETSCEKTIGKGMVALRISGDWVPNNASMVLPMNGKFSGACVGIDTTCQFSMQAGASHTVLIKAGCNARDYSVVKLGNGQEVLCIGNSLDGQNNVLLAAHNATASGKRVKTKKEYWDNTSTTDGKDNTQKIQEKWSGSSEDSAAHYCSDAMEIGSGASKMMDWYLPAIEELKMALAGWYDDIFIISKNNTYFSSTEINKKKVKGSSWSSSAETIKEEKLKYKDNGETLCFHSMAR